jgi:hypothetical protein
MRLFKQTFCAFLAAISLAYSVAAECAVYDTVNGEAFWYGEAVMERPDDGLEYFKLNNDYRGMHYSFVVTPAAYTGDGEHPYADQIGVNYHSIDGPQFKIKLYDLQGKVVIAYWAAAYTSCFRPTDVRFSSISKVTIQERCYKHCKGTEHP